MQNRYIDRYQRPPEDSLVRQSFLLPWSFLPMTGPIIRLSEEPPDNRDLKEKKGEGVRILGRPSRIVDRILAVPLSMPMVF